MAIEIERKFLLKKIPEGAIKFSVITQGYLSTSPERSVRVRLEESRVGGVAYITVKGRGNGLSRPELEYPIPFEDGEQLLGLCIHPIIKKTRYAMGRWELDEFHDAFGGLLVAEIELDSEDEGIDLPEWVGEEVTGKGEYTNAGLVEGWSSEKNRSVCW